VHRFGVLEGFTVPRFEVPSTQHDCAAKFIAKLLCELPDFEILEAIHAHGIVDA
jgi:hypothetical protein